MRLDPAYLAGMATETIQHLIDSGDRMEIWCHAPRCRHHAYLDLEKLRDKLGPDHGVLFDDIGYKLRCSKCGGREIGMIRHAHGNDRKGMAGAYNYMKASRGQ